MRGALCLIAGALIALPAPALAEGATATGSATAEVIAPLVVTHEADLDFGTVFASPSPGSVTVSAAGGASYSGGTRPACIPGACASPHPARFGVSGEAGRSYLVMAPSALVADGDAGGAAVPGLPVDGLSVRTASRPDAGPEGALDPSGEDRFELGGTLHLPADAPSAHYRATIPVMVVYG